MKWGYEMTGSEEIIWKNGHLNKHQRKKVQFT